MYCGDETGSFIGDIGSHTSRFGYGGEDTPKYVVPSYVVSNRDQGAVTQQGAYVPTSCYRPHNVQPILRMAGGDESDLHPFVNPNEFLSQGDFVQDWDAFETLWQTSFDVLRARDTLKHTKGGGAYTRSTKRFKGASTSSTVRAAPEGGRCVHPLLVVTPGCTHFGTTGPQYNAAAHREQMIQLTEVMMEGLEASSFFAAPSPMLATFSCGRQTALLVDVGAGGCRVTPVVDGLLLKHSQRRNGRGGDWLGNVQWKALLEENVSLKPRYQIRHGGTATPNILFQRWAMQDLMYEFRTSPRVDLAAWRSDETTPFVYDGDEEMTAPPEDSETASHADSDLSYELPDGTMVDLTTRIGKDLCRIPELLFTDQIPFTDLSENLPSHDTLSTLPLHKLIHASLTAVGDGDIRKDLAGNIILTGGSSVFDNLEGRLSMEVASITSSSYKCKVIASRNNTERTCAAWIGGSVLTSLGSFQQLWLSRAEYDEYGAALAIQRFP